MQLTIPKGFFMGAAMSGPQTEGAYKKDHRLESFWDHWSDLSISDFYNKVGSYVGNDFYEKYEEDIKLFKKPPPGFLPHLHPVDPAHGSGSEAEYGRGGILP